MNSFARLVCSAAIVVALIATSCVLDKRWRSIHSTEAPFRWGYFQALCFFPAGLLWFFVPFWNPRTSPAVWLAILAYGVFGSYAGYVLITKKERWAWMFIVVAQFNVIGWAINYFYGGKRWNEFRSSAELPNQSKDPAA